MIPEIGHFLLWLGLGVAITLGTLPMVGAARSNDALMSLARPAAYALFALVVISFICLPVASSACSA